MVGSSAEKTQCKGRVKLIALCCLARGMWGRTKKKTCEGYRDKMEYPSCATLMVSKKSSTLMSGEFIHLLTFPVGVIALKL